MRCGVFQRTRRRIRRTLLLPALISVTVLFAVIITSTDFLRDSDDEQKLHHVRRVIRSTSRDEECARKINASLTSSDQFPPDLFTLEQRRHGAILLHLAGLVYMFVALALVCDEFFVPSLSVLIEMFKISEDVAGATFMAAGGSAPEFFTSVFGVFVAQNNVGIGTIVGSATFNILCVLAFCTLFSREVLNLTWWPLFRDVMFYIIALLFLVIFFADEKISWHEALTMFLIYIIYGIFMKYNTPLEIGVKKFLRNKNATEPISLPTISSSTSPQFNREPRRSFPMIHGGQQLRNGIAHMAMGSDTENIGEHHHHHHYVHHKETREHSVSAKTTSNDIIFVRTGKNDGKTKSDSVDGNGNRVKPLMQTSTISSLPPTVHNGLPKGSTQTSTDNVNTVSALNVDKVSDMGLEEEEPLDLSWPETPLKRFIYILLAPIMFPLAYTLPDVRKPSWRSWFAITFIGSVLWIALFSYLMVWWANTIGETFGVSTEIMGLTVLAAGTSIPDLITSVIVARKGLGDMAVSSSIGSNLFDICVGLPIPWLLYFFVAFFWRTTNAFPTVAVISNGLICSVGMLFIMLVFLVLAIALSRWRMDKKFGLVMIISYVGFCVFSIFLETNMIECPLRISSSVC